MADVQMPPWWFSEEKGSMPIHLHLRLMMRFFHRKSINSKEGLRLYIKSLDYSIQTAVKEQDIEDLATLTNYLVQTYTKDIDVIGCVSLLRSLSRGQEEHMEDYLIRLQFFMDSLNSLPNQDQDILQLVLYLSGLSLENEEISERYDDLIEDLKAHEAGLNFFPKIFEEGQKEKSDVKVNVNILDSPKLEDYKYEGDIVVGTLEEELPLAKTHNLRQNKNKYARKTRSLSKIERQNILKSEKKSDKPGEIVSQVKLNANTKKYGFKIKHKNDWKKSVKEINWEKPLMVQFIQDADYSSEIVAVCALCVRSGKKDIFPSERDFLKHTLSSHNGNLAACDQCSYSCNTRAGIIRHRFKKHQLITEGYQSNHCPVKDCEFTAVAKKSIKIHLKKVHGVEKEKMVHKCPRKDCDFTGEYKTHIYEHLEKFHLIERRGERKIGNKLAFANDVKSSILEIDWDNPIIYQFIEDTSYSNKKVVVCAICVRDGKKEIIQSEYEFKNHCKTQHDEHLAACDYCPYTTKSVSRMASHRFQKHGEPTRHFPVKNCPEEGCKFQYCVKSDFNSHTNTVHNKDTFYKPTTCHLCGKWFKCSYKLSSHVRLYHEGFRYECDQCDKKYTSSRMLTRHKDKQHRGQGYLHETVCEECGDVFPKNARLQHIKRKHSKERTHHCKLCEKSFKTLDVLRNHERGVHQLGKYQCKYCNRLMQNSNHLRTHIRLHLKKKEYHCKICDCWYTATHTLALHIAMKHIGMSREEGLKKENIAAARNHPAYEYVKDSEDPLKNFPIEEKE